MKLSEDIKNYKYSALVFKSLLLKEFGDFCHWPLGTYIYFPLYTFGIIEKPSFPRCAFWESDLHKPPGLSHMTLKSSVFSRKNNMEDYFSQILQLITNVNIL
jgi:hypothetical protein